MREIPEEWLEEYEKIVIKDGRHFELFKKRRHLEISLTEYHEQETVILDEIAEQFLCQKCPYKEVNHGRNAAAENKG